MPARFLLAAGLLILELAVVKKSGYRWRGHWRDLDEIKTSILREPERVTCGHDAQLVSLLIDDPHLRDTDHLVYAQFSTQPWSLI